MLTPTCAAWAGDTLRVLRCVGAMLRKHVTLAPDKCALFFKVGYGAFVDCGAVVVVLLCGHGQGRHG